MLRKCAAAVLFLSLSGCSGYKPLYGTASGTVAADISALAVEEQHTRAGQIIRNELLDGVKPGAARYNLKLVVTEKLIDVATLSSRLGSRRRVALSVHYDLIDTNGVKSLTSGDSFSNVEFDTINQPVADLQAAEDAKRRAGKELGQDIRLRIAAFLSTPRT